MNDDRNQKTTEVRETNERTGDTEVRRVTTDSADRPGAGVVVQRIIYYIAGFIIAVLALRILLLLLAANRGSAFVDLVYDVSYIFAWPFFGIFNYQPTYGQSTLEVSSIVAIIVYALIAMGIAKLFTLASNRRDV